MAKTTTTTKKSVPSLKVLEIRTGDRKAAVEFAEGKNSGDVKMIPIDKIKILPGLQSRLEDEAGYEEGIEALVNSIKTYGFMQDKPLTVFTSLDGEMNPVIYVGDGHGRLEAAKRAIKREVEIDSLPCIFVDIEDSPWFDAALSARNNTQRVLTPMSLAVHVLRAVSAGKTMEEAAAMLDITKRHAYNLHLLAKSPRPVRDAVKSGEIAAHRAVSILRKHKEETDAAVAEIGAMVAQKRAKTLAKVEAEKTGVKPPVRAKKVKWSDTLELIAGTEVEREKLDPYNGFFTDEEWDVIVADARSKKRYKINKNVVIKISITRDADETDTEVPAEEEDDGLGSATVEPAAKKGRKGGRKKAADAVADPDEADAPDISGIADRA